MDSGYLNLLPEAQNRHNVELLEGERVVFAAKLSTVGTEKDSMIGTNCDFTLTNKRMIIDNHGGVWTVDIAEDIADCRKVQGGKFIFKYVYFAVTLNEEIVFDQGRQKLGGFHLYFDKEESGRFEEIMKNLVGKI